MIKFCRPVCAWQARSRRSRRPTVCSQLQPKIIEFAIKRCLYFVCDFYRVLSKRFIHTARVPFERSQRNSFKEEQALTN